MQKPSHCKDLWAYIGDGDGLSEKKVKKYFRQIVMTANRLQELGIYHGDLKDENFIIDTQTEKIFLIDFGSASYLNSHMQSKNTGTLEFSCPETLVTGKYYQKHATIWSLGIVLYCLLFGDVPWNSMNEIIEAKIPCLEKLSPDCQNLLSSCLDKDTRSRINLENILDHPWINISEYFENNE